MTLRITNGTEYDKVAQSLSQQVRMKTALFPGASVSTDEFSVLLLSIFLKHDMSYQCVTDVLKLFQCTLLSLNLIPLTHHRLMEKFMKFDKHI